MKDFADPFTWKLWWLCVAGIGISTIGACNWIEAKVENYNKNFDAACRSRGGVPTQLSRERICVAPGVMK